MKKVRTKINDKISGIRQEEEAIMGKENVNFLNCIVDKIHVLSWKKWVFFISFFYTLIFTVIFGFLCMPTEMGLILATGTIGMCFPHLDKIARITGPGIELVTRVDNKIKELEEIENNLKNQEKELTHISDYMTHAFITAFRDIGVLHIQNQQYTFAVDVAMVAVQLYSYNPKESSSRTIEAILSGMIGWLSEGRASREPIIELLKEKQQLILSDYAKMNKNNAPEEIIRKYEKVMEKAGIEFKNKT